MIHNDKKKLSRISLAPLIFLLSFFLQAPAIAQTDDSVQPASFKVSPEFIDEEAEPSGLFEYNIKAENGPGTKVSSYPIVRDLTGPGAQEGAGPTYLENPDRSKSLASWIKFPRSVLELDPGETKEIPLSVKISPYAENGVYYAEIAFSPGSNLPDAENNRAAMNVPRVSLRFKVAKKEVEQAEINFFTSEKEIFTSKPANFSCRFSNNGNTILTPKAEIRIYGRNGSEITSFPINSGELAPGASVEMRGACPEDLKPGRYKARIKVDYGTGTPGKTAEDIAFFWVLPARLLLIYSLAMLLVFIGFLYLFSRNLRSGRQKTRPRKFDGVLDLKDKK
jgi:hypothetical protein